MPPFVWHNIEADEALLRLESSATGLTTEDAQKRLAEHGPNAITEKRRRSLLAIVLEQFSDFMIVVLLVSDTSH